MLSIQPLESAEGAASYYLDVVNYYAQDSKSIRWLGSGAKELGINGQTVDKEQMLTLLQGILPDGRQLGRVDKDGIHHRPGFDMTVSAPKSFSILLETGADLRLAPILDDTVDWFVSEMEKEFAQTRQVVDGEVEYVNTQNLVVAAFRQPNSRANDPQSHVHLVVHNMTHCQDGQWRSLASDMEGHKGVVEQIMRHQVYGGLKFRNKLANTVKGLGYELVSDHEGLWEIKGVPEALMTHFSKRRGDIEALLEEKGWSGSKASSIAAQKTKMDKELIDIDSWRKDILQECHEHEFDPHHFVTTITQNNTFLVKTLKERVMECFYNKEQRQMQQAQQAVYVAIESVSQQQAVFDWRTLKKEALKYSIAGHHIIDEEFINKAIQEQIKTQNLYEAIHPYTKKHLLTTPWQLTLESESIACIEQGKNAIDSICSKQKASEFIHSKENELEFSLSASQKKAMISFLTTKDRYIAIQGYAGTGKTTMLRLTNELASQQGYTIRGITAGSSAAHELSVKGGLDATTFARELGRLQQQKEDLSKTIFVVDEASMLSNPQGHKIIKLVEQFNTQLKIIGDKAQLPSPSSGRWFSVVQDYGIHTVTMTDNLRQKDEQLKESALHASRGEVYDAVEKLTHVHTEATYLERVQYIAKLWLSLTPSERDNTLCFAPTHRNRHDITVILREALQQEGQLTGATYQQAVLKERNLTSIQLRNSMYYSSQDVIRFNTPIPRYRIQAGDYLSVNSLSDQNKRKNTLSLKRANGTSVTLPLASLPKFKTHQKDLERPIEVYQQDQLQLMVGDKIQWKRNSELHGIRNSELSTIKAITSNLMEVVQDNQKVIQLSLDAPELKHLDHGYVLTTYAAQGKDKKRGIGLIESFNRFSTTIQNFYVEITRAIESMTVVTDDKDTMVKAITCNDAEKSSALEMVSSDTLKAHETRFKSRLNLREVVEKKITKETEWNNLERKVAAYLHSKQENKAPVSAKIAYDIVYDSKLYFLAKERLGFKSGTYRADALRYQTSKLFHSLDSSERYAFSTVRQYIALNQRIAQKTQHKTISHSVLSNKKELNALTVQRNQVAAMIVVDLERFKPYLKHYSIGELNRIGLPQHEYRQGEEAAVKNLENLSKHAQLDGLRKQVVAYLNSEGQEKEFLAVQIKREAKLAHPLILSHAQSLNQKPQLLWQAIHQDAQIHRDRLFREALNPLAREAFDKAKSYKKIQIQLKMHWAGGLKNPNALNDVSQELLIERNKLAEQLLQHQHVNDVLDYFKLDRDKLGQHKEKHAYRANIQSFVQNTSNFKARLEVIERIKEDIKGHYPFIHEASLSPKLLSKYGQVAERQERLRNSSLAERKSYQIFLHYKMEGKNAYRQWQEVHQNNQSSQQHGLIKKAMSHSAARDALAYQFAKSPFINSILSVEGGNKDKILAHSAQHELKLKELKQLNKALQVHANQFLSIHDNDSKEEVMAWQNNWAQLGKQIQRVAHHETYKWALKECWLDVSRVNEINKELAELYDYNLDAITAPSRSVTSKHLQRFDKTSKKLDAQTINEALMVEPERTYKAIWGEPKLQSAKELRYGGGLIVTLKGKSKGLWYDFSDGIGGSPIQAIMKEHNIPFPEALKKASDLLGYYPIEAKPTLEKHYSLPDDKELENKIRAAQSIWNGGIPIKRSIAERYLKKHRGIDHAKEIEARFWPAGAPWTNYNEQGTLEQKTNKIPALLFAARNKHGELTGVQRIYLDAKTAKKNVFLENAKLSKGIIEGSAGLIQKGMKGSRLYIAEGPETAASVAMADRKATVLISFGISNIKNMSGIIQKYKPKEVILAADNDGSNSKSKEMVCNAIELLKANGIEASALFPDALPGKSKTDWNDILLNKGVGAIQKQLLVPNLKEEALRLKDYIKPHDLAKPNFNKSISFDVTKINQDLEVSRLLDKNSLKNNSLPIEQNLIKRELDLEVG